MWRKGASLVGGVVRRYSEKRAALLLSRAAPLQLATPEPRRPQPHQVNIHVEYCSLNSNDIKYIQGNKHSFPFIPGYELSGEILEVGEEVSDYDVGERVVALAPDRCGGLASQIVIDAKDVWKMPSEITSRDAAALIGGHATALLAFTKYRPINEGDVVLIIAGAGGFGLAAVDIAASIFKAKVIALADTEGKASLLRDRGAFAAYKNDLKLNYKEIMKATDNKGVDLIYDAVGGPILNTIIKCLKDPEDGAILATYHCEDLENVEKDDDSNESKDSDSKKKAKNKKNETDVKISKEVVDRIKTVSLTEFRNDDYDDYYNLIEQTLEFCKDGLISPHVSQNFKLDEINEAIDYIKGKMCTGKVVIHVES